MRYAVEGSVRTAAAEALAGRLEEARASAADATRLRPTLTVRSFYPFPIQSAVNGAEVARMLDGMRRAGLRDHVDEDADAGVAADAALHTDYEAPTPITLPGARAIRTAELIALLAQRQPLVLDTAARGRSIPGAAGLWGAGVGGNLSDGFQARLDAKLRQRTPGDRDAPMVTVGRNAERFQGRNLALRLVALGYTSVAWYRDGSEAWEASGAPTAELVAQDW